MRCRPGRVQTGSAMALNPYEPPRATSCTNITLQQDLLSKAAPILISISGLYSLAIQFTLTFFFGFPEFVLWIPGVIFVIASATRSRFRIASVVCRYLPLITILLLASIVLPGLPNAVRSGMRINSVAAVSNPLFIGTIIWPMHLIGWCLLLLRQR